MRRGARRVSLFFFWKNRSLLYPFVRLTLRISFFYRICEGNCFQKKRSASFESVAPSLPCCLRKIVSVVQKNGLWKAFFCSSPFCTSRRFFSDPLCPQAVCSFSSCCLFYCLSAGRSRSVELRPVLFLYVLFPNGVLVFIGKLSASRVYIFSPAFPQSGVDTVLIQIL